MNSFGLGKISCELYGIGNGIYSQHSLVRIRLESRKDLFASQYQTVLRLTSLHSSDNSGSTLVWFHANNATIFHLKNQIEKLCGFELNGIGSVDGYGKQIEFSKDANLIACVENIVSGLVNSNGNDNTNANTNANTNVNRNTYLKKDENEIRNENKNQNEDLIEYMEKFDELDEEFDDPITNVFRVAHSRTVSKQMEDKLDLANAIVNGDLSDSDTSPSNEYSNNKNNSFNTSNNNSHVSHSSNKNDVYDDDNNSDVNDDNWDHLHSSDSENDDNKDSEYTGNNSSQNNMDNNDNNNNGNGNGNGTPNLNSLKIRTAVTDSTLKKIKGKKFATLLSPAVEQDILRKSWNAELTDEMAEEIAIQKLENEIQKERDGDDGTIVQSTPLVHSKLVENFEKLDDNWSDFDENDNNDHNDHNDNDDNDDNDEEYN